MIQVKNIEEDEFLNLLKKNNVNIPIWSDVEAINCYKEKELIKVCINDNALAVFLIPINNNGVRREFRYFPYLSPIFLKTESNIKQKEVLKVIFNYIFNKYDYTFIPLHPDFKMISSIQSEAGFVEMRHTHIIDAKITMDNINSNLRNHIRNAKQNVDIIINYEYENYDFLYSIKGSKEEIEKRSNLAKQLIKNKKAFVISAKYNDEIIAGAVIMYDNEWAYLLHSYNKRIIRGVVPYLIQKATEKAFAELKVKYFDFEGSVINEIDDFFSNFNANIVNYPYVIYSKNKEQFYNLVNRAINIEGRINKYE